MRITSKGQITIPQQVRRELGLEPGDEVDVVVESGVAHIVPLPAGSSRGQRIVEQMRGRLRGGMSTDEIMALTRGD